MIRFFPIAILLIILASPLSAQTYVESELDIAVESAVRQVNALRAKGCRCGSKKYGPAESVRWNTKLEKSSRNYAKEMFRTKRFAHVNRAGENVGERIDKADYFWQFVGENIGEGHTAFSQVFKDWILSPSHCKLLMDPRMKDLGIGRYGKYWVLHMATQMPKGTKRSNIRYN